MVHSYCVALEGAATRAPQTAREARALPRLCAFLPDNCLRLSRSAYERTSCNDRHYWWQRSLPDGGAARYDRTQNRHTIWTAVGPTRRWKIRRASGLFFAPARPRPSDSAARNKSPRQHLRAPFVERSLDRLGGGGRQLAGKICAARSGLTLAVLRSHQSKDGAYIFR